MDRPRPGMARHSPLSHLGRVKRPLIRDKPPREQNTLGAAGAALRRKDPWPRGSWRHLRPECRAQDRSARTSGQLVVATKNQHYRA